ncbi:MAG: phosphatidylglycerophosphatase A [Desulfovermiculus sp.]|nr:phosphatidylglycerophosphatase A [Desulfovermiculus sp.]
MAAQFLNIQKWLVHAATLGPVGRIPFAPGTWGSLAAVLATPWIFSPLPLLWRIPFLAALFFFGSWAAGAAEKVLGLKDPGSVVIDECMGQFVVFAFLTQQPGVWHLGAGFVLFRLFDICKPWPVVASETWLPSGFGIMLDDVLAGVYAGLILFLLHVVVLRLY